MSFAGPVVIAAVVGTICLLLALASWRALLRTGNRGIYWVVAAFATLSFKNFVKAFTLSAGSETDALELIFSLLDLVAVSLFAWPLLRRFGVMG